MQIASVTAAEHADFLALVNAEIRPDRAKTNAWDDFPLILSPENSTWQLVARTPGGDLAAGLACLICDVETSLGRLPIAGIGSVVTAPEFRGQGLSTALQNDMLRRLHGKNIPLAVLWTDQPAIYAGRGFVPAGWELHIDLSRVTWPEVDPAPGSIREFVPEDAPAVEALFHGHRLHTWRSAGHSAQLYGMPGTRGLVLVDEQRRLSAAVFCGKGADFPDYVAEWDGPPQRVVLLLAEAGRRGWAHNLLAPAGAEAIVDHLVPLGAAWLAQPSGYWVVVDPEQLRILAQEQGVSAPEDPADSIAWLGHVDEQGRPQPGLVDIAIWGLDSV